MMPQMASMGMMCGPPPATPCKATPSGCPPAADRRGVKRQERDGKKSSAESKSMVMDMKVKHKMKEVNTMGL